MPIVLTLDALRQVAPDFSFDAYLVVYGQPPVELHSQADDMNYDGQKDELVFLIDLEPQETKEVSIRYAPNNQMAVTLEFTKRTRAGIFPELKGLAALESELNAYLLNSNGSIQAYCKKEELLFSTEATSQGDLDYSSAVSADLQRAFESKGIRLPPNATIEIKKQGSSWLITNPDNKQGYFIRKGNKQLNIYKAGGLSLDRFVHQTATPSDTNVIMTALPVGSFGCGGFALWDKANQKLIPPPEGTQGYVRVLANGPVRSIVQWIIPDWQLSTNTVHFTSTLSIYAGHEWAEHRIRVQGLGTRYRIATGVPNLGIESSKNEKEGWLWTLGEQVADSRTGGTTSPPTKLGMGLLYPAGQLDTFQDSVSPDSKIGSLTVLLNPDGRGEVVYRFVAVCGEGEMAMQTKGEWEQYVQITATENHTPPVINFVPQKPAKK